MLFSVQMIIYSLWSIVYDKKGSTRLAYFHLFFLKRCIFCCLLTEGKFSLREETRISSKDVPASIVYQIRSKFLSSQPTTNRAGERELFFKLDQLTCNIANQIRLFIITK